MSVGCCTWKFAVSATTLATAVFGLGVWQTPILHHGVHIRHPIVFGAFFDRPSGDFVTGWRFRQDRVMQFDPERAASLRNEVVNDATMDIGESKIPTSVPVGQFLMIETE
jgi:hypothetical protein